jgi:hypothetical protein
VAVLIESEQSRLHVYGDIQGTLYVPAAPPRLGDDGEALVRSYYIALSDGSLIQASNHENPEFDLVVEGAGNVSIGRNGKSLTVDWRIEWINLSPNQCATAMAYQKITSLPLLDRLIGTAA